MVPHRAGPAGLALLVALFAGTAGEAVTLCPLGESSVSVDEVADRVEGERLKYLFVGERHDVGAAKRFAVDLANLLVERGQDVGLYVEGFRTDCAPADESCRSLARAFDAEAFFTLLGESRAPVHPIDPPQGVRRAARMAETIAAGSESVRVVLVGRTHVLYAGDPDAELWIYGGGLRYPDPGDLAEAFPRNEYLTFSLEAVEDAEVPYALRAGGCGADYALLALRTPAY